MSLDDSVAFLTEREQATRDELADAQWEREQRIERAVTFDDVLEEMAGFSDSRKQLFMVSLARANESDADSIYMMVSLAKQRVIARRLAAGE